jgi:serine-type D-Ala-D-Ala carboxypeptidase/endopeptidase (penicillin-binding protein 4)
MIMKQITRVLLLVLFVAFIPRPEFAADPAKLLQADLTRIFSDARLAEAQLGIKIISLDRGEILFEKNSSKLLLPASNNKIVTAAAALVSLGPDYRFKTQVLADGPVLDGVLKGNLIILGFGDPSSSTRIPPKDPFGTFREWAAKLKEHGIRAISGSIIGDGRSFEKVQYGRGWGWDDLEEGSAAPISALQFNENRISLEISPGLKSGSDTSIKTEPLANYLTIDNRIMTEVAGPAHFEIERNRSEEAALIRGSLSIKGGAIRRSFAVQYPIRYYLSALKHVLDEEGIDVLNCEITEMRGFRSQTAFPLWTHTSPPLSELLVPIMKMSLNLASETLARTLGLEMRGEGSFLKGKEVVEETLGRMGINKEAYSYADGSGLSRLNLISADALVSILKFMHKQPFFLHFYNALPVAGVDGTLEMRMRGTKAENSVHAKTGSLTNVSSLSGYAQTRDGETLAFSILSNNFLAPKESVESIQDRALARLSGFSRKISIKSKAPASRTHPKAAIKK